MTQMTQESQKFDLIVIGGGPGGYPLAAKMARAGWSTALVERPRELGGTCLNRGCIPTKALLASAKGLAFLRRAEEYGLSASGTGFDWSRVLARKDGIVTSLQQGIQRFLGQAGVKIFSGSASLQDDRKVIVTDSDGGLTTLEAGKICLATGSVPVRPAWVPDNKDLFWTSDEALNVTSLPESLLVVGGGIIGIELGQVFADFGVKVTVVEFLPTILPGLDSAVAKRLLPVFRKGGMTIFTGTKVESLQERDGRVEASFAGNSHTFERVLTAIGRRLNRTVQTQLTTKLEEQNGFLRVSERFETSMSNVFAVGDAVPGPMLAHKASYDAWVLGEQWLGKNVTPCYEVMPACVFTHPEVAWVGLSEDQARQSGEAIKLGRSLFSANGKAQAAGESEGQLKTVFDRHDKLIGAVIWGPDASNLIMEPALMMARQISGTELLSVIHPHPTLSESFVEAVADGCATVVHG